jgi:hypothetical protein
MVGMGWSAGVSGTPSRRLARPLVFCRTPGACPLENGYARPVERIHVLVDMRQMKVKSCTNLYAIFAQSFLALNIFSVGIIISPPSLQSKYLWVRYVSELLLHVTCKCICWRACTWLSLRIDILSHCPLQISYETTQVLLREGDWTGRISSPC